MIQSMKQKYEEMSATLQNILSAIGNVEQPSKNKIAKQLIMKGEYKSCKSAQGQHDIYYNHLTLSYLSARHHYYSSICKSLLSLFLEPCHDV
jgi:hypothetical protein